MSFRWAELETIKKEIEAALFFSSLSQFVWKYYFGKS